MKVLHISDIHYRKQYTGGNLYEDMLEKMDSGLPRAQKIIDTLKDRVDVLVITGDICDEGTPQDYRTVKLCLDSTGIPYVVCLGNHDCKKAFYAGWYGVDTDVPYMQVQVLQDIPFISFDNSQDGKPDGYIDEERLQWVTDTLQKYPGSVVLQHHQFEDLPGIPALENGDKLKRVLIENTPLAVLTGHTHWYAHGTLEGIPYFTAPSISFRAVNKEDGSVIFSQSEGYAMYEITKESVKELMHSEHQDKPLAVWKF